MMRCDHRMMGRSSSSPITSTKIHKKKSPLPAHCELYQLYAENNIKASLFYIGSNLQQYPASGIEGFEQGHHICVHSTSFTFVF